MRHAFILLAVLMGILAFRPASADRDPGEVVVQLRPGTDVGDVCRDHGLRVIDRAGRSHLFRLAVTGDGGADAAAAELQSDTRVVLADANDEGDPIQLPTDQWTAGFDGGRLTGAYTNTTLAGQVNFTSRAAQAADGSGVIVAVLDTGVSARHPSLAAQMLPGWNFVANTTDTDDAPDGIDNDGDGWVDEATGHGTMVAGLVLRFAPRARLLPVRVLDTEGRGSVWTVVQGIQFAVDHGARVINLSLGFARNSKLLTQAIREASQADVVMVTSAGNGNTGVPQFPAGNPRALTVAALNVDNTKADFSNYGATVDVDAPGAGVVSTFWDGTYAAWSGTSFSTAIVSGQAALIRSRSPALDEGQVRRQILASSHSVDDWNPNFLGMLGKRGGLVDFDASLLNSQ